VSDTFVPLAVRTAWRDDDRLGCGNFLFYALEGSPAPDRPLLRLHRPFAAFDGGAYRSLSLRELASLARRYAALYHQAGVLPRDCVAVYLDEGAACMVHYTALTSLGAIPVLVNGAMKPGIAARFIGGIGVKAVYTDPARLAAMVAEAGLLGVTPLTDRTAAEAEERGGGLLPSVYPYRHAPNDPVLICHSSGTTGMPKAITFEHRQFFAGIRTRLTSGRESERVLSALPHSHSAGIAFPMYYMLMGVPVLIMSDLSGGAVLAEIEAFRPTTVIAFPQTYAELAELEPAGRDTASVEYWMNTGDCAHERHIRPLIRAGSHIRGGRREKGSVFLDGLGSSEMGFTLFRKIHSSRTTVYGRCVGYPNEFVDAAVLSPEGETLPPGETGMLGIKSPTVTSGYWNQSSLTYRSRLSGYWLTGDMVYKDDQGMFFHVDRVQDVIRGPNGPVYSLLLEEEALNAHSLIRECAVFGVPAGDGFERAAAVLLTAPGASLTAQEWLALLNEALGRAGLSRLVFLAVTGDKDDLPCGPTGKILKRALRERYRDALTGPHAPTGAQAGSAADEADIGAATAACRPE